MALLVQPVDQVTAKAFVDSLHRHHRSPLGSIFQIGVNDGVKLVGVIIVGRPVSRRLDDGMTLEVTRCCTDGTKNACSILYARAQESTFALGWSKIITYTLPEEGGASLRASGWICEGEFGGGEWKRNDGFRVNDHPLGTKLRWSCSSNRNGERKQFNRNERLGKYVELFD
jgi:hypothetical protein